MRILHLTHKPPFPEIDGGSSAIRMFLETMTRAGHEVYTLTVATKKHPAIIPNDVKFKIQSIPVNTNLHLIKFLRSYFSGRSYFLDRFYNKGFDQAIKDLHAENEFQVIVLDGIQLYSYLKTILNFRNTKIIYRSHNIEFQLFRDRINTVSSIFKKWIYSMESNRIKKAELELMTKSNGVACISSHDKEVFHSFVPTIYNCIVISPFGQEVETHTPNPKKDKLTIGYLGAFDWEPNLAGLLWFMKEVWPTFSSSSKVTLNIAGKRCDLLNDESNSENINIFGEVSDPDEFLRSLDVMIVPLFHGSGIRMKIIHAMSHQLTVIATTKSIEGIPAENGKHVFIADTKDSFINHINMLLENPEIPEHMGLEAGNLVRKEFSRENSAQQFQKLLETIT